MKIIIDFDNTICQFSQEFERRWELLYKEKIQFDGSMTCLPKDTAWFFDGFYDDTIPYDNANDALKILDRYHDVVIVTHSESKEVTADKKNG